METFNRSVKFKVGLSNGDTFYEGKVPFELIGGELSPWLRLKDYLARGGVQITSLALYTDGGQTWNLPSAGKNPKFSAFSDLPKPKEFNYKRIVAKDIDFSNSEEVFVVIEALYDGFTLQVWVSEGNPKNSWTLSKEVGGDEAS